MTRNEQTFMGVRIVKWRGDRFVLATKIWRTYGTTWVLRPDGSVLYSNDRFFTCYASEKDLNYKDLVEALFRLGAITKDLRDDYFEKVAARDKNRSLSCAASELRSALKTLGLKLSATQQKALDAIKTGATP